MHARVTTYQSPAEQLTDEAIEKSRADILPRLYAIEGNRGALYLVNRETGKTLTITLWETEDALKASEQTSSQLRQDKAKMTGGAVGNVESFEVRNLEVR